MASPVSPQSPPSPTASFYDMSDDEEGEYNTIRHTSSGRGVKLLYTKSKVTYPIPLSCGDASLRRHLNNGINS